MVPPYSFLREFASKQAHLECQKQTLFSRHGALNLKLESLRRRACVVNRHAQMLPRWCLKGTLTTDAHRERPAALAILCGIFGSTGV